MTTPHPPKPKFLTYRVQNIPYGISKEELKSYFYVEDRDDIKVKSLCPSVDTPEGEEGDYTATIFFRPHEHYEREPRIAIDIIDIDKTFIGFTPLYVPKEKGPIAADIIALSGLAGHAYGSWAHAPEHMWIRDYLPRDAPNARILTYGYPATLQGNTSISTLQDYTATFVQSLIGMRDSAECESRPIIFIGHSLGCLIIKKALADIALMGVNPSRLPVRTIIFLSAPHRGLNVTAMQTLVKGKATQPLIDELSVRSRTLIEINQRFAQIASDIDILTCYETKPTKTAIEVDGVWQRSGEPALMVELDSAQLYFPKESLMAAETDHSQISKIKRGEGGIYSRVKSAIRQGLVSTARIVASVEANPEALVQQFDVFIPKDVSPPYASQKGPITLVERPKVDREDTAFSNATTLSVESESVAPETSPRLSSPYSLVIAHEPDPDEPEPDIPPTLPPKEEVYPEDEEAPGACDICGRDCTRFEPIYSCRACVEENEDEDFSVCKDCKALGIECPNDDGDGSHEWRAYILRGETYQVAPIREILPSDLPIIRAVKNRNAKTLTALAKNKRALSARDEEGDTPLHIAIRLGFEDMVRILLDAGADLELLEMDRLTPLMLAIRYFYPRIAKLLLDEGADVNWRDGEEGGTPLYIATVASNKECVKILLEHKPIVDDEFEGRTPLVEACIHGDFVCARMLLDAGADPNFGSEDPGASPLVHAIKADFGPMIILLLIHGAKIDAEDSNGYSGLHWAASEDCEEACTTLLEAGANANCYDNSGQTPLMIAASAGHLEIVTSLLEKGKPNVNERSFSRWTALTQATTAGHIDIVKLLIQHGATGNPTPFSKWKDFPFSAIVPPATKQELLEMVRKVKHIPERRV